MARQTVERPTGCPGRLRSPWTGCSQSRSLGGRALSMPLVAGCGEQPRDWTAAIAAGLATAGSGMPCSWRSAAGTHRRSQCPACICPPWRPGLVKPPELVCCPEPRPRRHNVAACQLPGPVPSRGTPHCCLRCRLLRACPYCPRSSLCRAASAHPRLCRASQQQPLLHSAGTQSKQELGIASRRGGRAACDWGGWQRAAMGGLPATCQLCAAPTCSFSEMPRTGPRWIRFIRCCRQGGGAGGRVRRVGAACPAGCGRRRCFSRPAAPSNAFGTASGAWAGFMLTVVKPAILLRRRLDWMIATSSQMRLLVSKSSVRRW